jgi:8-oxo-dGTP pyrophosphatase MutT (NUDIX family)
MYKAAGVLLTFNNLVLLGRRSHICHNFAEHWSMPCGMIESNEDPKLAAIREVYEETLITLNKENTKFLSSYGMGGTDKFAVFHSELGDLIFPDEKAKDFFEHDEWGYYNIEENSLPTPMTENTINSILMLK